MQPKRSALPNGFGWPPRRDGCVVGLEPPAVVRSAMGAKVGLLWKLRRTSSGGALPGFLRGHHCSRLRAGSMHRVLLRSLQGVGLPHRSAGCISAVALRGSLCIAARSWARATFPRSSMRRSGARCATSSPDERAGGCKRPGGMCSLVWCSVSAEEGCRCSMMRHAPAPGAVVPFIRNEAIFDVRSAMAAVGRFHVTTC